MYFKQKDKDDWEEEQGCYDEVIAGEVLGGHADM